MNADMLADDAEDTKGRAYQCPESWAVARSGLEAGMVVACPEGTCAAQVAVTVDRVGFLTYEPHAYQPKPAKPARRAGPLGYIDEAGQWQVADREDAA